MNQFAFLGVQELAIILVIVLVLFGGSKIPEVARNMGKSVKEIKKGFEEGADSKDKDK